MLPCEQIHAHPNRMWGKPHAWWESAVWTQMRSQRPYAVDVFDLENGGHRCFAPSDCKVRVGFAAASGYREQQVGRRDRSGTASVATFPAMRNSQYLHQNSQSLCATKNRFAIWLWWWLFVTILSMSLEYSFTEEDLMSHECLPLKTFCLTSQLCGVGCGLSTATYTKELVRETTSLQGWTFMRDKVFLNKSLL